MNQYRHIQFGPGRKITKGIRGLIIANAILFVLTLSPPIRDLLIYYFSVIPRYTWSKLHFWQPFTYMFLHGNFWHIALNMFGLWMFGTELEIMWGKREFLKFFFITGIGAGIISVIINPSSTIPIIGASGAIYGILLAYGMQFPERIVYIYGLFPIKTKYFVIIFGGIEFLASIGPNTDGIAHFAHLSGMIIGFIYLRYFRRGNYNYRKSIWQDWKNMLNEIIIYFKSKKDKNYKSKKSQMEIDEILDKLSKEGYDKLTKEEKEKLL
ncbi:MAG: rhomboid family intramembrane serine protease [Candidatus Marinimicrobia bacterium]|nr:rhomboid family intramembrane serine protease [Candidatus Neomarinimicrobiota bacterium]